VDYYKNTILSGVEIVGNHSRMPHIGKSREQIR